MTPLLQAFLWAVIGAVLCIVVARLVRNRWGHAAATGIGVFAALQAHSVLAPGETGWLVAIAVPVAGVVAAQAIYRMAGGVA